MTITTLLIAFLSFLFLVAAPVAGWRLYLSSRWHWVDLLYYPTAAIGVLLFFINSSAQRQIFELDQAERLHRDQLSELMRRQPQVAIMSSTELVDSSFALVQTIADFAHACRNPHGPDPRCAAAEALRQSVTMFMQVAEAVPGQPVEARLVKACPEADRLILALGDGVGMSSLVGQELVSKYKVSRERRMPLVRVDLIQDDTDAFERLAKSKMETVHALLEKEPQKTRDYVTNTYLSEIEFGKVLLRGLMPCITSDRKEIEALTNWTTTRQTEEEQVASLAADRKKVADAGAAFPTLAQVQHWAWPFVIGFALALKFAKGVATWRKHHESTPAAVPVERLATSDPVTGVEAIQKETPSEADGAVPERRSD